MKTSGLRAAFRVLLGNTHPFRAVLLDHFVVASPQGLFGELFPKEPKTVRPHEHIEVVHEDDFYASSFGAYVRLRTYE
jgi:hypothetical protein